MGKDGLIMILLSAGLISLLWLPTAVSGDQVTVQQTRGDSDSCSFPNPLALKIVREVDDDVTLSLTTNQNIRVPHRVVLMRSDANTEKTVFEPVEIPQTTVAYHSSENMACFVVECLKDTHNNATIYTFNGTLFIGDAMYQLYPHDKKAVIGPEYISQVYLLEHVDEFKVTTEHDYVKAPSAEDEGFEMHASSPRTSNHTRDKRQAVTDYYIDVLPVIDYRLYSRWLSSHNNDANQAVSGIVSYFTNIFTGIALRYTTLNLHNNIVLNIQMVTPHISTDPATSQFTENHKIHLGNGRYFVNIYDQLTNFSAWTENNPSLPVNDHAMLFTGYQWYGNDVHNKDKVIGGLAWTFKACTKSLGRASSVVQDLMGYQSEYVATHELGHSLGSLHDGSDNTCEPGDKYIMSPYIPNRLDADNMHNPFKFSTCSSEDISEYVAWLETKPYLTTCLTASSGTELPDVPPKTVRMESICPAMYGNQSDLCIILDRFPLRSPYVCKSLYCRDESSTCKHVIPPSGMCCANGKYCVEGVCSDAPGGECVLDEECPFEDVPVCQPYIRDDFSKCDNEIVSTYCCHHCSQLMKTVTPPPNPPSFTISSVTLTNNMTLPGAMNRVLVLVCQVDGGIPRVSNITLTRPGYGSGTRPGYGIFVSVPADPSISPIEIVCSAQHMSGQYNQTSTLVLDITSQTDMKCDPGWHLYKAGNACIKMISRKRNGKKARKECRGMGADIVTTLKNSQQRAFVKGLLRRVQHYYVGINDWDSDGVYQFVDGSPMNGTPIKNKGRFKKCVILFKGMLVATKCYRRNRFICQKAAVVATQMAVVHVTLQSQ